MTKKLVCAVGTGNYRETTYRFCERTKTTNLAPIAIGCCAIEPNGGLELVALLTAEAEAKHGAQLKTDAEGEGWIFTKVGIAAGKTEEELWEIFEAVGDHLEDGDDIVLDLTHGFRHLPALLLSSIQYYAARKKLNLLGIFYGAWDASQNGKTPIFDLTPLYDLSEWAYGVRLLRDYQFSAPLGEMLDKVQRRSHQDTRPGASKLTRLQGLGTSLKKLEIPLVSGIPLESGFEANEALKKAQNAEEELARIAPMKEPRRELKENLETFALQKPGGKANVRLTLEELQRQSRLIEGYLKSENLWAAANLLREWVISAVIFHSGDTENWLDHGKRREPIEIKLGALSKWNGTEEDKVLREALTENQRKLVGHWESVSDRRNALAHAGMRVDMTDLKPDAFRKPFDELRKKLGDNIFWSVETEDKTEDVWMISPLGTTPGALFTAIKKAKPSHLLIVTSEQGKRLASAVLHAAEREDLEPRFALLDDPFNGFSEVREKKENLRREHGLDWIRAGEIFVNLTGGTTCLGWAVGQLENGLARMGLEPKTVACIDRRTPEEQRRNPYQEGEMQNIEPIEER